MPKDPQQQKGSPEAGSALPVILLSVIGLLIAAAFLLKSGFKPQNLSKDEERSGQSATQTDAEWPVLWGPTDSNCQENPAVKFSALPVAVDEIEFVEPMGELKEGHIMPGDHIGINYKTSPSSAPVKVYAPADGTLVTVEKHAYAPPPGYPRDMKHYHFYLIHSCTQFTGFVHLTEFDQAILNSSPELKNLDGENINQYKNIYINIPVKAGQVLGTTWSFGLLGMVTVDLNKTNRGYLNPDSYKAENWRIHAVPPFEYFTQTLKSQLLAKNPRTTEPRGGKIDFDIEGKLVGNWFREGTGGFRDENVAPKQCGNFPCPYWDGHIAFVYDYIDPAQLRISIGDPGGLAGKTPFGVLGNAPDFKDIGVAGGLVKYGLVGLRDISRDKGYISEDPLIEISDESQFLGTMLVQVIDKDTIKVEIFPGKAKGQVSAFTSSARIYSR